MNKFKKAFTLIELLVVIAIIGILATLAIVALQNSRANARDSKRFADIKQMQTALELYFNDNKSYPTSVTSTIATGSTVYMDIVPSAPTPVDGDCSSGDNAYNYSSDGATYSILFCLGSRVSGTNSGKKQATASGVLDYVAPVVPWTCGDVLVDSRDSQQYPTVQIGTQCWFAKNINYNDGCSSNTWSAGSDRRWCGCYSNNESNCTTYGRFYQWSAAMAGSTTAGAQGICPSGWHVPTSNEFNTLNSYVNSQSQYLCNGTPAYIGKAMAATQSWGVNSTNCTIGNSQSTNNSTGFNMLSTGYRYFNNNNFYDLGYSSNSWLSSSYNASDAFYMYMFSTSYYFESWYSNFANGYTVRCIKN